MIFEVDESLVIEAINTAFKAISSYEKYVEVVEKSIFEAIDRFANVLHYLKRYILKGFRKLVSNYSGQSPDRRQSAAYLMAVVSLCAFRLSIACLGFIHISQCAFLLRKQDRGCDGDSESIGSFFTSQALVAI